MFFALFLYSPSLSIFSLLFLFFYFFALFLFFVFLFSVFFTKEEDMARTTTTTARKGGLRYGGYPTSNKRRTVQRNKPGGGGGGGARRQRVSVPGLKESNRSFLKRRRNLQDFQQILRGELGTYAKNPNPGVRLTSGLWGSQGAASVVTINGTQGRAGPVGSTQFVPGGGYSGQGYYHVPPAIKADLQLTGRPTWTPNLQSSNPYFAEGNGYRPLNGGAPDQTRTAGAGMVGSDITGGDFLAGTDVTAHSTVSYRERENGMDPGRRKDKWRNLKTGLKIAGGVAAVAGTAAAVYYNRDNISAGATALKNNMFINSDTKNPQEVKNPQKAKNPPEDLSDWRTYEAENYPETAMNRELKEFTNLNVIPPYPYPPDASTGMESQYPGLMEDYNELPSQGSFGDLSGISLADPSASYPSVVIPPASVSSSSSSSSSDPRRDLGGSSYSHNPDNTYVTSRDFELSPEDMLDLLSKVPGADAQDMYDMAHQVARGNKDLYMTDVQKEIYNDLQNFEKNEVISEALLDSFYNANKTFGKEEGPQNTSFMKQWNDEAISRAQATELKRTKLTAVERRLADEQQYKQISFDRKAKELQTSLDEVNSRLKQSVSSGYSARLFLGE